jgi:hypothetical protein
MTTCTPVLIHARKPALLLSLFTRTIPGFSISSGGPSARKAHIDIVLLEDLIHNPIHTVRQKCGYLMSKSRLKGESHEMDIFLRSKHFNPGVLIF